LYEQLLSESPTLSDDVMLVAISKEYELPKPLLADILSQNPQAANSQPILDALANRSNPLDEYQMNQVLSGNAWHSFKENLQYNIEADRAHLTQLQMELFSSLVDHEYGLSAMLKIINEDRSLNELKQKADLFFKSGIDTAALSLIEDISTKYPNEEIDQSSMQSFLQLQELELTTLRNSQHLFTSDQIAIADEIYNQDLNGLGFYANVLLHVFAGYPLDQSFEEGLAIGEEII